VHLKLAVLLDVLVLADLNVLYAHAFMIQVIRNIRIYLFCTVTNFTVLKLTNMRINDETNYWHCGPPNQNFGLVIGHGPP